MSLRPAYHEIVLEHGSHAVVLRPSLRAASTLERSHGFDMLFRHLAEFHTGTVRAIILTAATDRKDAAAFLETMSRQPIASFLDAVQVSIVRLCLGFVPVGEADRKSASSSAPTPWREFYGQLYRYATGWLHWTPEAAWSATPTEIMEALAGHGEMLTAIHGPAGDKPAEAQPDPEQAARNEAAGLDPEFDRAGLQALKAKYGRKPR